MRWASIRETKTGSAIKASKLYQVKAGDFVYNRLFAWKGTFAIASEDDDDCFVSNEFPCFTVDESALNPSFLWYFLKQSSSWDAAFGLSYGVTALSRNRLSEKNLLSLEIPLPLLSEQRRIVAKIERLAGRIEEGRETRSASVNAIRSLMGNSISRLFSEQSTSTLGDYVIDDCYGTSEKTFDDPIGVPILRMGNIQKGSLAVTDLKYLEIAEKDRTKWILRKGDILVNRTNSAELVGKCAVFDLEGNWGYASYLIRLRLDTSRADPQLVAWYINSPTGRAYMLRERKQMTGQANVNSQKLKALPLLLPPLPEQRRIVAYLNGLQAKVDQVKRLQAETAAELDALLPAILDRAFKGEL